MAKLNNSRVTLLLVLTISLFLIVTISESIAIFPAVSVKAKAVPECDTVFGVGKGDTCFDIAQNFKLSTAEFDSINPNINCAAIFVGQWVCVDGTA